jgi:hypothetical protein
MNRPYVRIVRRPMKAGEPTMAVVQRVEIVDGDTVINLPCQDLEVFHPVQGVSYVRLATPFFTEVTPAFTVSSEEGE